MLISGPRGKGRAAAEWVMSREHVQTRPDGSRRRYDAGEPSQSLGQAPVLASGTLLRDGRFHIERRIGRGAMGEAYLAWDRERDEYVALKLLLDPSGESIYRIKQEFRSISDVIVGNLVRLFELFEDQGRWFFTMEYVAGRHLIESAGPEDQIGAVAHRSPPADRPERAIARPQDKTQSSRVAGADSERLPPAPPGLADLLPASPEDVLAAVDVEHVRATFAQLAAGICAIHEAGQLHRDLKPSNVLLTDTGRVVILDFGLARSAREARKSRQAPGWSGTPAYMAPECAAGEMLSEAVDWYAFGVMLYEALAGCLPFEGTGTAVLIKKQRGPPPAPSVVRGQDIDAPLEELCMALLRRDPEERAGAAEVWAVLGPADSRGASSRAHRSLVPDGSVRPPLAGRRSELRRLERALSDAKNSPSVFLIPGVSGIGKTALMSEACERLRRHHGALILGSRCYERESVPFKALDGALDALTRYLEPLEQEKFIQLVPPDVDLLGQVFPVLRRLPQLSHVPPYDSSSIDKQVLRRRAFRVLAELLGKLAEHTPVVLALDDLQWMDIDSVRLLMALLSTHRTAPLLLLATYRSEGPPSRPLEALLRGVADMAVPCEVVTLSELDDDESADLIRSVAVDACEDEVKRMVSEAVGSPYYALQLAYCQRAGLLRYSMGLTGLLALQVRELDPQSAQLLAAVCLSPGPSPRSVLFQAVGIRQRSPGLLAKLRQSRLIRLLDPGGNPRLAPYHDRVREVVVARMDEATQRQMHEQLALAWRVRGEADPEVLLAHYLGAGRSNEAATQALSAAHQAERGLAFERAAACYGLVLALGQTSGGGRMRLLTQQADALAAAGRGPRAAQCYLKAAELAEPEERLRLRWLAARQLLESRTDVHELLFEVLGEQGMPVPNRLGRRMALVRALLRTLLLRPTELERAGQTKDTRCIEQFDSYLTAAVGLMFGGDLELCVYFFLRCIELGPKTGEPGRQAIAWIVYASTELHTRGASGELIEERLTTARHLLVHCTEPFVVAEAQLLIGQCLYAAGRLPGAHAAFEEAAKRFSSIEQRGAHLAEACLVSSSFMRLLMGDLSGAEAHAVHAVELGEARGQAFYRRSGHYCLATLALCRADLDAVEMLTARLSERGPGQPDSWFDVAALQLWSLCDIYRGTPEARLHLFRETEKRLRAIPARDHYRPWALLGFGNVCLDLARQRPQEARKYYRMAQRFSRELTSKRTLRVVRPCGRSMGAAVYYGRGEVDRALAELTLAEEEFANLGALAYRDMVRLILGQLLGGDGGKRLSQQAELALSERGVAHPSRLAHAYFPGFSSHVAVSFAAGSDGTDPRAD